MPLSEQEIVRREKLAKLRELNVNPYPAELFPVTHLSDDIKSDFKESAEVVIAGRLMSRRIQGKASFAELQDSAGRIQVYFNRDEICTEEDKSKYNEVYKKLLDIGDIIGVMGGYLICTNLLNFNPTVYLQNTYNFVQFIDVFSGLVKASVFGFIITFMGCYHGFNASGGAQGVGQSTTYSVVSSSILILLMNYIITSIFFTI